MQEKNHEYPIIMDGREFSTNYSEKILKTRCKVFRQDYDRLPSLLTILVGDDPGSLSYLKMKERVFSNLCINSKVEHFSEDTTEKEIIDTIIEHNNQAAIDGILVQLPLPNHMHAKKIIRKIAPEKDVEGLSPHNIYSWVEHHPGLVPPTALGVVALLKYYNIPLVGKHVVIVGRSIIVGKPLSFLFLKENATVTICHSKSRPLEKYTKKADILVSATGIPHIIKEDMVKEQVVVVDVGVSMKEGKLTGDVDFDNVKQKASYISPVPGGSGPVTVNILASNLLLAFELQQIEDMETKNRLRKFYENFSLDEDFDS